MCQLERNNRDLNDENERLRQQLREADEQCHQQVADAVRSRDEAWRRCKEARRAIWELMDYYASSVAWSEVCEMFPQYPWLKDI
jgi:cell division septum initiation protein DivIVA